MNPFADKIFNTREDEILPREVKRLFHADLIAPLNRMAAEGSGFYSLLARAWLKADLGNSRRLFSEFGVVLIPFADSLTAPIIEHAYDNDIALMA